MNYYERIQRSIDFMEENLENEFDLTEAARVAFMSLSNYYRLFLAITGYTVKEYVRLRRLSRAALDLIEGKERVIDLAVKYAYTSADAFSRAFKSVTGYLPSKYRDSVHGFYYERMDIMDKYFEVQEEGLLNKYPNIKVMKELEPRKVAYYCYYGQNPESHAFEVIKNWVKRSGIHLEEPKYRIFGYNNPNPTSLEDTEYGYEVCVTIDEGVIVEDYLVKTKMLEGGLYAVTNVKRGDDLGQAIMETWKEFSNWIKGSKYMYGGHQWLEEHLGFNEDADHIGGVDLYMPIVERVKCNTEKTFEDVSPMWVISYQATGRDAIQKARDYFFRYLQENQILPSSEEHRIFAYYNFERIGKKDFFYRIHMTVGQEFQTEDPDIVLSEFKGGRYAVMDSCYKYNEGAWGEFMDWISKSREYTVGDYWFFEEYLIDEPKIEADTKMKLYMPITTK